MYDEDGIISFDNEPENAQLNRIREIEEIERKVDALIETERYRSANDVKIHNLKNRNGQYPMSVATREERLEWAAKGLETKRKKKEEKERIERDEKAARDSIRYLLSLQPTAKLNEQMAEQGIAEEKRTNMMAMILKQFTMAIRGNTKSFENLMKYAGYEPGESRRDEESKVRIEAIRSGQANAVSSGEEGNDVLIYLPEIESVDNVSPAETPAEEQEQTEE